MFVIERQRYKIRVSRDTGSLHQLQWYKTGAKSAVTGYPPAQKTDLKLLFCLFPLKSIIYQFLYDYT
jgi:hypothetical protein